MNVLKKMAMWGLFAMGFALIGAALWLTFGIPIALHDEIAERRAQLTKVNVDDGINQAEADIIGEIYYRAILPNGCGGSLSARRVGDIWVVPLGVGFGAKVVGEIRIHARTGRIDADHWQSFPNFSIFQTAIIYAPGWLAAQRKFSPWTMNEEDRAKIGW